MRHLIPVLALLVGLALGAARPSAAQAPDPCAPTATSTATSSPSPSATTTPGGTIFLPLIYDDAPAAGWSRSGYSVTYTDDAASPYSGAKSMRMAFTAWGGVRLTPSAPTSLSGTLHLALRGSGRLRVLVGSTQIATLTATSAWAVHRVALPGGAVSWLELKNDLSTSATMFVDLVGVEGQSAPTATAGPAAPTPGPTQTAQAGAAPRVLPLGDSITEGVNGGYRPNLAAAVPVVYVGPRSDQGGAHAGTPGFNTGDILRELPGYLSAYDPDVVLLMIGTNDLAWWTADPGVAASTAANVGQIIDLAQAAGARVVLATVPPISSATVPIINQDRAALVADYNARLRALAASRGLTLVDVGAALTLGDLYDGVHPSEAAHDTIIAPLFAAALR